MKVLLVGLSNKKNKETFDITTPTGKIVSEIKRQLKHNVFMINLVNYPPVDEHNKLRYPTKEELKNSIPEFLNYVNKIKPDLIIAFGNIVYNALNEISKIKAILISKKHPSYIYVYRKKEINNYIADIINDVNLRENK